MGRASTIAIGVVGLVGALALGLAIGSGHASLWVALVDATSPDHDVVFTMRLPRVVLGAIAGGGLAAVGVAFQAVLRNPLAEPYVLGVSGGSALGATIAILLGLAGSTFWGASMVPLVALACGLGATMLVYGLARSSDRPGSESMLLAGVVVNAIAAAAITFMKTLVSANKAQELLFWLMGFLDAQSPMVIAFVALYVAIGLAMLMMDAARLNVLSLGDDAATHLGIDVRRLEFRVFVACSLVTGAIVSATGLIGFVGLIVPHALRRVVGPDARKLLPASVFGGAAMLVVCDAASRGLYHLLDTAPPVGAITALVGGPLFVVLMRRGARRSA
jgi:iron complex transport system permease protein